MSSKVVAVLRFLSWRGARWMRATFTDHSYAWFNLHGWFAGEDDELAWDAGLRILQARGVALDLPVEPEPKKVPRRAPLPVVDQELEARTARARGRGNRAEHRLRDDAPTLLRLQELQTGLRRALNAEPRVPVDVLAALVALERFVEGHAS